MTSLNREPQPAEKTSTIQQFVLCSSTEACDGQDSEGNGLDYIKKKETKTVRRQNVKLITCIHIVGAGATL